MFKRLFSISGLNVLAAGLNFASTYVTVKILGLTVFGDFNIFSAKIALISVIYLLIPSNYSIFKYQDDENYKYLLGAYFLIMSFLYGILLVFFHFIGYIKISLLAAILYAIPVACTIFFDIKFQATNQLNRYFFLLSLVAFVKLLAVILLKFYPSWQNVDGLLGALGISQILVLFYYIVAERDIFFKAFTRIKIVPRFIKQNFGLFKDYYLNAVVKRIKDNSIVLMFSYIVPAEMIGLFSLFIKINSFVLGLSRTIEAFFMNRDNLKDHFHTYNKYYFHIAVVLQFIYLLTGVVYMKLTVNKFYIIPIMVLSLLVYPYLKFLVARIKFLSEYNNRELVISMTMYICFILVVSFLLYLFSIKNIFIILGTFFISEVLNYSYIIIQSSRIRNKTLSAIIK